MIARIIRALFPQMEHPFQDTVDPPGEVQKAVQIALRDTEPLEKEIRIGARFPTKTAERRMVEIACGLRRGLIKGRRASVTFHFRDGSHIDVTISKPYLLRRYRGGCIVELDAPSEEIKK